MKSKPELSAEYIAALESLVRALETAVETAERGGLKYPKDTVDTKRQLRNEARKRWEAAP